MSDIPPSVPCPYCGQALSPWDIVRNTYFIEYNGDGKDAPNPETILFVHAWVRWEGEYLEDVSYRLAEHVRAGQRVPQSACQLPQFAVPLLLARLLGLDTGEGRHLQVASEHVQAQYATARATERVAHATYDVANATRGVGLALASPRAYRGAYKNAMNGR